LASSHSKLDKKEIKLESLTTGKKGTFCVNIFPNLFSSCKNTACLKLGLDAANFLGLVTACLKLKRFQRISYISRTNRLISMILMLESKKQ
jgi:hypothetical protein